MKAVKNSKAPLSSLQQTNRILTTFVIFIRMNITLRDNTFIIVLLPVKDHKTPTYLRDVQMLSLLVTQSQKASSSVLELDDNYLPT